MGGAFSGGNSREAVDRREEQKRKKKLQGTSRRDSFGKVGDTSIPAVSPTGGGSMGYGVGSQEFNSDHEQKHFRTLVYRKRKLSDAALTGVIVDPIVSQAFREFMASRFALQLLGFWIDCNAFEKIPIIEDKQKRERASIIYSKYIKDPQNAAEINVGGLVREQIGNDLGIQIKNNKVIVTQTDLALIRDAFKFSAVKVFQELKFEHLPEFIMSDKFKGVGGAEGEGYFESRADAASKLEKLVNEMDINYIVSHPLGVHFLSEYVRDEGLYEGKGSELFEILLEIQDFESTSQNAHRKRRLAKIASKYNNFSLLTTLTEMLQKYNSAPNDFENPPIHLFENAKKEILVLLEAHILEFKETKHFFNLKSYISDPNMSFSTVSQTETEGMLRTKKTIDQINQYAIKRNISSSQPIELTFEFMMQNSMGLCYIKRLAINNFMEESIQFWINVQNFKKILKENEDNPERIKSASKDIMDTYIMVDSPKEINISTDLRENIIKLFNDDSVQNTNIFEEAEAEIFQLLDRNLWGLFQNDSQFEYVKKKLIEKMKIQSRKSIA